MVHNVRGASGQEGVPERAPLSQGGTPLKTQAHVGCPGRVSLNRSPLVTVDNGSETAALRIPAATLGRSVAHHCQSEPVVKVDRRSERSSRLEPESDSHCVFHCDTTHH